MGMSFRAIGAALGVDEKQVRKAVRSRGPRGSVGTANTIVLPTNTAMPVDVRPGSPNRYLAVRSEQPWILPALLDLDVEIEDPPVEVRNLPQ